MKSASTKPRSDKKQSFVKLIQGDCAVVTAAMAKNSVGLVFGSPPYANQRRYESDERLFHDVYDWVNWTAHRFISCLRVCRGTVCFVVEGYLENGTFWPLPEMLTVELMRRGVNIRPRHIYKRYGTAGGSPDEFGQHHEIIVRATSEPGRLVYAQPAAMGHPPKYKPGGAPTSRGKNDQRVNQDPCKCDKPRYTTKNVCLVCEKKKLQQYKPPKLCKHSNVIECGSVGGGNIGNKLAHDNEAPFPEQLVLPYIASYLPPGGTVLDPFCGSGTTLDAALQLGRSAIGIDNRLSQIKLSQKRLQTSHPEATIHVEGSN